MKKQSGKGLFEVFVILIIIGFIILGVASGPIFTSTIGKGKMEKALTQQGYTNIEYKGYSIFGCSDKDTFHAEFTATSPEGKQVQGIACSGYFKGTTIRW